MSSCAMLGSGTRLSGAHRYVSALRSVAIEVGMDPVSDEDARLLQHVHRPGRGRRQREGRGTGTG